MEPELQSFLTNLVRASNFAILPAVLVVLWRWPKLSQAQRFFAWVVLGIFLVQMAAVVVMRVFGQLNTPLYHLYVLVEGPALLLLFRYRLRHPDWRRVLLWLAIAFAVFVPINAFWIEDIKEVPVLARTAEAVIMAALALAYFRTVFLEQKVKRLNRSFWFWISAAVLLYFTSNLLLFMFSKTIRNRADQLFLGVWSIHAALNFMLYAFYAIAFLCRDQESSPSS